MCNETEREQVKKILMMPIKCEKRKPVNIIVENGIVKSTQRYYNGFDPDMSDFAVGFYNIMYKDILNEEGVLDGKYFCNQDFAGDTINSFNSIANLVPSAGNATKLRTATDECPKFLRKYSNDYHCLANFWILPMPLGRRGKKLNYFDSIDVFLNKLKESYDLLKKYTDYYKQINNYDVFCRIHFIENYKPLDDISEKYRGREAEEIVRQAYKFIDMRADNICANDEVCKDLYDYFKKWHLTEDGGTAKNKEES